VRALVRRRPRLAIFLGSGQSSLDLGRVDLEVPYRRLGLPVPRVAGHAGVVAAIGPALVFRGRVHLYEGRPLDEVVAGVRFAVSLGVRRVVLCNAAGALSRRFRPGDLMGITDHLNLMGMNPLEGGPNFVGLAGLYDRVGGVRGGVYAAVRGPVYETPAEARMLRRLGADAVGMSTVPEAIAAKAAGLRVSALSVIANRAGRPGLSHEEVLAAAARSASTLSSLLRAMIRRAASV
jgi:purine-nucleoside phosphorylase